MCHVSDVVLPDVLPLVAGDSHHLVLGRKSSGNNIFVQVIVNRLFHFFEEVPTVVHWEGEIIKILTGFHVSVDRPIVTRLSELVVFLLYVPFGAFHSACSSLARSAVRLSSSLLTTMLAPPDVVRSKRTRDVDRPVSTSAQHPHRGPLCQ